MVVQMEIWSDPFEVPSSSSINTFLTVIWEVERGDYLNVQNIKIFLVVA